MELQYSVLSAGWLWGLRPVPVRHETTRICRHKSIKFVRECALETRLLSQLASVLQLMEA